MMLQFYKMTGAGNDFVMVDNRDQMLSSVLTPGNIVDICDRRFGVGADGVIAVEAARCGGDVRMCHYGSDGAETGLSSDAACCFAAFVDFLMDGDLRKICFETSDGLAEGVVNADDSVSIRPPSGEPITGPALIVFRGEVIICEA